MGRVVTEVRLQERSVRARLKPRKSPYWRMISEGVHLGYYRGVRGGTWVARYRPVGGATNGAKKALGSADDLVSADGVTVLNWKQALDKASEWIEMLQSGGTTLEPNATVKDAVVAYIVTRNERQAARVGHPEKSTADRTLTPNVLRDELLSSVPLRNLTEADLRSWQRRLTQPCGTSKQRIMSELKAALNATFEEHRQALPKDFATTVKLGLKPVFTAEAADQSVARENQVLTDAQVRLILAKASELDEDGDHARLVILLAATGARFSQVKRMRVADVQPEFGRVLIPVSYKGRGKKSVSYTRVQVGLDVMDALRPALEGRPAGAALLERWYYKQTDSITWLRKTREPWKTPSQMLRWWQKIVEAAGLPGVIPYALRHSSIVRAIAAGLPIRLVAALHDTSTAMIEKHYARWIADSLDELAARAVVSLIDAGATPQEPMMRSRSRTVIPTRKSKVGRRPASVSAA